MKLRDKFWLWGHQAGYHNNGAVGYEFHGISRMTPTEACYYLGIRRVLMVPLKANINRRQYNKAFTTLDEVAWDCFGADVDPAKIDALLEDAKEFKNITAAVFDDFIVTANILKKAGKEVTTDALYTARDRLNNNGIRNICMWMVLYTHEFGLSQEGDEEVKKYLDPFNGVIMWNWEEKNIHEIPEKFKQLKKLSPSSRFMFGCYLYDFGAKKQATAKAVRWQLDFYREKLISGEAEGVVLLSNTMADMDFEAYDAAIEWLEEHGDEEI